MTLSSGMTPDGRGSTGKPSLPVGAWFTLGKPSVCRCGIGCFLADSCAMSQRLVVNRVGAPVRTALMLTCADSYHRAGPCSGADDDVIRARRAVEEVPLSQPPLSALDDEKRLAKEDE